VVQPTDPMIAGAGAGLETEIEPYFSLMP